MRKNISLQLIPTKDEFVLSNGRFNCGYEWTHLRHLAK